jgi:hypothetical protein
VPHKKNLSFVCFAGEFRGSNNPGISRRYGRIRPAVCDMKGLRRKTGHPARLLVAELRGLWMPFACCLTKAGLGFGVSTFVPGPAVRVRELPCDRSRLGRVTRRRDASIFSIPIQSTAETRMASRHNISGKWTSLDITWTTNSVLGRWNARGTCLPRHCPASNSIESARPLGIAVENDASDIGFFEGSALELRCPKIRTGETCSV